MNVVCVRMGIFWWCFCFSYAYARLSLSFYLFAKYPVQLSEDEA